MQTYDRKQFMCAAVLLTYVFTTGGLKNLSVLCLSTVSANSKASRQLEKTASTLARSNLQEHKQRRESVKRTQAGG